MRQAVKKQKWRLKKTLSRKVHFRPIEDEDVRFIWAAYKHGALASLGGLFAEDTNLEPGQFYQAFVTEVQDNYAGAWTLFAEANDELKPVGVVLGFYSHPEPSLAPFMIVGDILWFPWASARNKVETALNFFNEIRKEIAMVEYANKDTKAFFEMIAKHGVMRRIGTSHNVYPGEPTTLFETRSWH